MKNLLLLLIACLMSMYSFGQKKTKEERQAIIDAKKATTRAARYYARDSLNYEVKYCQIVAVGKLLSNKVKIYIDYGQKGNFFDDTGIRDGNGKRIKFHSVIDALNYMNHLGWDMINAYPITHGTQNVYHYYFKAREDARRGFIPKIKRDFKKPKR